MIKETLGLTSFILFAEIANDQMVRLLLYLFACKNSAKTDENRVEKYFDKYSIKDRIYQASLRLC